MALQILRQFHLFRVHELGGLGEHVEWVFGFVAVRVRVVEDGHLVVEHVGGVGAVGADLGARVPTLRAATTRRAARRLCVIVLLQITG